MVFSSIPVYLDPPNWHQQQNHHHHQLASSHVISTESPQLPPLPPQQFPPHVVGAGSGSGPGSAGSIRPGSMADRARLAKIPQPEAALKCPRCESTNTKFCYFNNYSLTQPRHFCKTCRRYWTRGGALRNVPVGGGCRRNKKNKSSSTSNSNNNNNNNSRSKSPATNSGHDQNKQAAGAGSSSSSAGGLISPSAEMIGHLPQVPQLSHNPSFMASIQNLTRFGSGVGNLGLNFSTSDEIAAAAGQADLGFQIGSEVDQWRLQQFPLLGGGHHDFESTTGNLYPFQSTSASTTTDHHHHQGSASGMDIGDDHHHNMSQNNDHHNIMMRTSMSSPGSRVSQYPPVKMEERQGGGLNLLRSNLGISSENSTHHNYNWGPSSTTAVSTAWTDLSALNSSTTTTHHIL